MASPTIGIESQGTSVRAMGALAAAADEAGLAAAWAPELYDRSATISVAEMCNRTERCTVGTAIAYGVGRSPLTLAAEARDLDEISDGRFVLGLGNGTRRMISDWHGQDPEAPAVRVEELVPLLRRIWNLSEGPVDHEGRFYRLRIKPTGEVAPPARAIPASGSTSTPRIGRRSITSPSSQVPCPATECPPPRTASSISFSPANRTAAATSASS